MKLNIKNPGNYKVKYLLVDPRKDHDFESPKKGEKVPQKATEYVQDSQFILWAGSEVFVYLVDNNDNIQDVVDVNETWHHDFVNITLDKENKKLILNLLINPDWEDPKIAFKKAVLFGQDKAVEMSNGDGLKQKLESQL